MTTSADKVRMLKKLENAWRIEARLTNLDWFRQFEAFEEQYEALLDEFYGHLIDIDDLIVNRFSTETRLQGHFKTLLETGRQLDDLWDRYHRDQLKRTHFSRLLSGVARTGNRLLEAVTAALSPMPLRNQNK